MYTATVRIVAMDEIALILAGIVDHLPTSASFIVPYPYTPRLFVGQDVRQTAIVGLLPSQQLVAHCDPPINANRYHLPLRTNPGCWSFSGGVWQQLEVGKVYRMDPTEEHGAVNWGSETRLHLMIDVAR